MPIRPCAAFLLFVAGAFGAGTAIAKADEPPLRIEREQHRYTLNADGSFVETVETAIKVMKEAGVGIAKDSSVGYSTSIQKAEILSAYTLKADGRKIEVPPGNFQESTNRGQNGDSPIYSDRTTLTVVFPELAVGDTTVLSYRLIAKEPMFPGQFSIIDSFSPARYYGEVSISVDAPESLPLKHVAWQMKEIRNRSEGGRRIVELQWKNREPVDPESLRDSIFDVERYPGYAFSTFASYAQISEAYGTRAKAKAAVTPRIAKLADDIAGDAKVPRETAKRLYEWVSREISYAGNCIGLGAVVPRDLDVVLDNKMGDCKDHATLLQALLEAKGIDSTQALVNAGQTYTLPKIPVASMVNHVINYVPAMDLYLDSTAAVVPFGSLPESVAGKRVLLVDGYRDDSVTPAPQRANDWQRMKTTLRIAADGSVKGTVDLELNGRLAVSAREQFRELDAATRDEMVENYFRAKGLSATGTMRFDDPKPMEEHFGIQATFDVESLVAVPGGFTIAPWFLSVAPISGIVASQQPDPERPAGESACGGMRSEEEYVYDFAEPMRIVAIPPDATLSQGPVSYTASHRRDGNRIVVKRLLDDRTPGPVCSAEYNEGYSQLMRKAMINLRAQIVYLAADPLSP
jgi:transglutaminase-like putative cysteine protease